LKRWRKLASLPPTAADGFSPTCLPARQLLEVRTGVTHDKCIPGMFDTNGTFAKAGVCRIPLERSVSVIACKAHTGFEPVLPP
jgi:hypothetical protein